METKTQDAAEQATPAAELPAIPSETVTLDTPIQRGKQTVTEVTIRKPLSGALRGVALVDLLSMETQSLQKVLPRITEPALTETELRKLDPADLVQLGSKLSRFLLGKRAEQTDD
ncbi:phage tail assembly protein [Halomonas sp. BC04]|uniref:phage tail assembly protein n=1 Tax=Halomonas sp. BC04 TaxID=1403540 RepID=UPI0003ED6B9A|nr:phage tail assembly protein [Halomonas sp. BC04]EWH00550.1 hypothetical protein Q427_19020 [Halomonas sp. BC04]